MKSIVNVQEVEKRKVKEGIEMCVLAWGENLMMTHVSFKKDAASDPHSHMHEQMSYVVKGEFVYMIGDQQFMVKEGHSIYIQSNVQHSVRALTDGILIDVFTPIREDFLKKGD